MSSQPLTPAERAACAVCADWLATSTAVGIVAWFAVAAALAGLATGGAPHPVLLLVPLAVFERFLAVRVALDARLFDRLATGSLASLDDLDAGLRQTLSVPASKAGRPLAPRLAGARRLYRWQTVATALIVLLAILAWC
ncbi:hypothetical protein [Piscinibacter gummiphilus]|uniref:Uncharacterized protein n=1 Tax=Piscinibacter gummiphilus TaxID=946333 RepID=A0A1W6LE31_9BURK|nr:hypothetical protein [Piscinibacter gummiphilus]ARN22438.1 hypothetical protein A4W93_22415 [Piscinibacter gummiphilus]ATU67132.1 hypothetical protein CPZ87_22540 [Piscinibacter gummiphilus]GLS98016.1 hypothetical protein GCM10007918_53080 [Piscinibacter gummiphilus]